MKKSMFLSLIFLSLIVLIFRFGKDPTLKLLGYQEKAGLKVTSLPEAAVFVDGVEVGKTPYQDENLKAGEADVKLIAGDSAWRGRIPLNKGTLSVVGRELAPTIASSSGELLILYPGKGVIITSTPEGSDVEIDGKAYGKTPVTIGNLPTGEHIFLISKDSYLKRSVRVTLPEKLSLRLNVDLAVAEADLGVTVVPTVTAANKVIVKKTPNGFLRVRARPSTTGQEIARVSTGDSLTPVEELGGWAKVKLDDGREGYVSSQYVQKQ